ncbi:MAG: extracellular solute-binding protein [Chloroflexi bacterium]|nr:extracellular solute-binding protein [Chloroflexota bacterium]
MSRRSPRWFASAFAIVAIASLVGACSPTASPSPSSAAPASVAPTASGAASPSAVAQVPVTITVGVLRPGATQAAVDALNLQISEFEAKYPGITVEPEEYDWTAPTFTAALAAGTLPDVFTIPFTDGKGLIAQDQIVNIDERVRALGYADKFNPNVLVNGQSADGKISAVPIAAYGMSLTYNRTLFTQAGLDPDKPPTTWDEVRATAKTIAEKTGVAGFAQMATENTGGWQITTSTYALGGRMQTVAEDGKATATLNNPETKAALERLKAMRWEDKSMGSTFDYAWGSINQAFAAGQIGMFTGGSDLYTNMVQNNDLKPADYGVTTIPLASSPTAGVLGGGTLAAVNVVTREEERDAAVKWIDFYYLQKLINEAGAVADAKALVANNQPVGVPALPIFDKATYDQSQIWIKDYINVPVAQMVNFTSKIFDQPIVTEPTVKTQELYGALDPVVQAVLTDQNADIDALLAAANTQVQAALDKG